MFLAVHGITRIHRVTTDNGAYYRWAAFSRIVTTRTKHHRARPFTPQHNSKVERYQQIMAEKALYAQLHRSENEHATALATWNIRHNHHRPHSSAGDPVWARASTGPQEIQGVRSARSLRGLRRSRSARRYAAPSMVGVGHLGQRKNILDHAKYGFMRLTFLGTDSEDGRPTIVAGGTHQR